MRTRQLSDLRNDVRKLSGTEGATTFMPDSDVTELINQAWTRVYGVLARSGETYFLASTTFSTVNGQDTYYTTAGPGPTGTNVLPLDLWDVKGVDVQQSNGYWLNARRLEFEKRNDYQADTANWVWPVAPLYDYQQMGNSASLKFVPIPGGNATSVRLWYFPAAVRLAADGDTFDGGNGWERWAIAIAARWVAIKDENYELVQVLDNEIGSWDQAVRAEAQSRNIEEAPQMRRVRYNRRGRNGWPFGGGFGGY